MQSLSCKACSRVLPETEFPIKRAYKNGRDYRCKPCANAAQKRWRDANLERVALRAKEARAKHPERYKAWNEISRQRMKAADPDYVRRQAEARRAKDPIKVWAVAVKNQARMRAKRKGLPFDIDVAYVLSLVTPTCPIFGTPLEYWSRGTKGFYDNSASLDRMIPENGYVRGNLVVISLRANMIKKDATLTELMQIVQFYVGKLRPRRVA